MHSSVRGFHIDQAMRYSLFVPRLYNLCRSMGDLRARPRRQFLIYEQSETVDLLLAQSPENRDQIDLEAAIQQMIDAPEVKIPD